MEIAQAALALFQIGFDDIAAVTHPLVPGVALGEFFGDERPSGPGKNFAVEPRGRLVINALIAPDVARLQQRRADRQVAFRQPYHFIERARRMADLQPQVPQRVEH